MDDLIGKIVLNDEFSVTFHELDKELDKAQDGFERTAKSAEKFSRGLDFGVIAGGVAGITSKVIDLGIQAVQTFGGFVAGSVEANAGLETVVTTFTQLLGSASEATSLVARLKAEAGEIGQPFEQMSAAAQALVIQAGGANEEFDRLLKIAELLAAVKPEQGLEGAAVAISEFVSSGGKDLVSLSERFNLSKSTIRQFTQDGKTDLASLATALEKTLGSIGVDEDLIEAQKSTLNGLENQINAFISEVKAAFGEPIFDEFKETLGEASEFIKANKTDLLELATSAGETGAILLDTGKILLQLAGTADTFLEKVLGLGDTTPIEKLNAVLTTANQLFIVATSGAVGLSTGLTESIDQAVSFASERLLAFFGAYEAGMEAARNLENPFTAFDQSFEKSAQNFKTSFGDITNEFTQSAREAAQQTFAELADLDEPIKESLERGKDEFNEFASAGQAAASTIAQAYADLAADREKLQASLNQKIEAAEFDHAQRIIRIQQDIARATAEAAAEAAAAREASAAKLNEGLAEIDRDLFTDSVKAQDDYNRDIARLDAERAAARRKAAEEVKKVESDLRQDLRALRRDTRQAVADVDSDLADDLADRQAKAEEEKLKIIASAGEEAVRIQKRIADQRKAVNDAFESEFAEADPFRRKILEFNRQEQLKQLEQQEKDELAALDAQAKQQLSAVDARVAAEAAILEREAQQKKDRLTREAAERAEALKQEAAERKAAIEARLAEELAADNQRRADLAASLAAEQAARNAAAEEAKNKLIQKNAEELAAIDAQEVEKVARAQEALERENQNHADRLAQLQFANQQEVQELQAKLREVEQEEARSYLRRLQETRTFVQQYNQIMNGLSNGGSAGFGANPGTIAGQSDEGESALHMGARAGQVNQVTVNNYGVPGGYAGASQTGRTVLDALRGR